MPQVPAIVEQARQEIVAAQEAGDQKAANAAYGRSLELLQAHLDGKEVEPVTVPAALPPADIERVLGEMTAGGHATDVAALRELWPGAEMGRNLAYAGMASEYLPDMDPEQSPGEWDDLWQGVVMAERLHGTFRPGKSPPVLPPDKVEAFLADHEPAEADVLRSWLGGDIGVKLGTLGWLLDSIGGGLDLDSKGNSETDKVRFLAAVGRAVQGELEAQPTQGGTTKMADTGPDAADVQAMGETEYEDALTAMRTQTDEAQAQGDSRRANRLYAQQQTFIAARQGSQPIVGRGGRTG